MAVVSVTGSRIAILAFLLKQKNAFISLQEILKMPGKNISRTTLYRTLMVFCDAGIIYKITDNKNKVLYGLGRRLKPYVRTDNFSNSDNYHFQCRSCGTVYCLSQSVPPVELPAGFIKTDSNFLLTGFCEKCSAKKKS